jgi:hypothetical protein
MRISRKLAALGAFFVLAAAIVAGCGSSSSTSVGSKSVASMAGNQVPMKAYRHWSFVAAKAEAAQEAEEGETGAPVITATDPPKFTDCIKQVRVQLPQLASTKDPAVKKDCNMLFAQLNPEVMGFLIQSYWYQADAHKLGITVTDKQADAAYAKEKKQEFPTKAAYASYLSEGGLTDADVRFEVRINTIYAKLAKPYTKKVTTAAVSAYYTKHKAQIKEPLAKATAEIKSELLQENQAAAAKKVTKLSKKNWGKMTKCAPAYAVATYCSNYKAPKKSATSTSTSSAATGATSTSSASGTTSTTGTASTSGTTSTASGTASTSSSSGTTTTK